MTHRLLIGIQLKLLDGVEYGTVIMKTECIIISKAAKPTERIQDNEKSD